MIAIYNYKMDLRNAKPMDPSSGPNATRWVLPIVGFCVWLTGLLEELNKSGQEALLGRLWGTSSLAGTEISVNEPAREERPFFDRFPEEALCNDCEEGGVFEMIICLSWFEF